MTLHLIVAAHIAAGSLALVFGYTALFVRKGATVHKKSGLLFVYAMVTMLVFAVLVGIGRGRLDLVYGVPFVVYLLISALLTVREPVPAFRWLHGVGLLVALASCGFYTLGSIEAVAAGGQLNGVFAPVLIIFAVVALLAAIGDLRVIRSGPLNGPARLARHLWRMCYSFYVATGSFFLGQADELPEVLRIWPLLFYLALLPLLAMFYWLWRVRSRRPLRNAVTVAAPEPASA